MFPSQSETSCVGGETGVLARPPVNVLTMVMHPRYEYRRRLPHYQPDGKIFFITFCTYQRWTLPEGARQIVLDVCRRGDGTLFELLAAVIMPDHAHLALVPRMKGSRTASIAEIMQAIKGASAHRINRELGRRGSVWQEESFDRALRDEEQIGQKIDYMLENPVRAGLVMNPVEYPWIWRKTEGWEEIRFTARSS